MNTETKYIAFYLPQYHEVEENNKWWGKGFTEWVRVKESLPVFEGHNQPRIPYDYYDLDDTKVMERQALMAKEYGIYGFCYYHYWFKGKKLLHKPLEQMLSNTKVDIPFCLSWANEKWTRAWEGKSKEVLINQDYGNATDWKKHLDYLIPFFKDKRYIRIDDKPVLLIYRTSSFLLFDKMIEFWNRKMTENGLPDIYIVETLNSFQKEPTCINSDAVVEFEPMFTLSKKKNVYRILKSFIKRKTAGYLHKTYRIVDYKKLAKRIVERDNFYPKKARILGGFVDWDNTPRFKEKGTVFINGGAEAFKDLLVSQKQKSETNFLFINAWNEWAEGAHLEPDLGNGMSYLQAVKDSLDCE